MTGGERFTVRGSEALETRIRAMLDEARQALSGALPEDRYRAVLLIGGYGRREGGVDRSTGEERPNNNLDFLVVARRGGDAARMKALADEALAPLVAKHGIGMDVGVVAERALLHGPCLVMWYDMRFGHVPLLGDGAWVRELRHITRERIERFDVENLLVNRGTLLVINRVMLESAPLAEPQTRAVVRHVQKAIIGYGDALLYFLGSYDASYRVKRERMRARRDVAERFRAQYDQAMEARLEPRYDELRARDLAAWNDEVLAELAPVHLECERRRLGDATLEWPSYPERAFRSALVERLSSPRAVAKKALALSRTRSAVPEALVGRRARLGYASASPRERLSLVFPLVAYRLDTAACELARQALAAASDEVRALDHAYLAAWGKHGDVNFHAALRRLGLDLDVGDR